VRDQFSRSIARLIALIAVSGCTLLALACNSNSTLDIDSLHHPRGLAVTEDGALLVADAGNGRILRVVPGIGNEVLRDGLPVTWDGGPGGDTVIGVSGLHVAGADLLYVVGEFRGDRFRRAYRLSPAAGPVALTNVGEELPVDGLVNPYDVVALDGEVYISDAGANAVFRVLDDGGVALYARLPRISVSSLDTDRTTDPVPTGLAAGPDGAIYLATLAGAPYAPGSAAIYRLADLNDDGDALGDGETEPVVEGLTAATDVAFTDTGWLLTTEFSLDMAGLYADLTPQRAADLPGRVTAWCGAQSVVVAADVSTPTSVVAVGDLIVVAEEFAGRVTQLDPRDTPWDQPCTAWRDAD
jgi:hypothetical protein